MEPLILTRTQRRRILDALKSSPLFDTLDGRTLLLRDLPQVLCDNVRRDTTATVDLDNIVETAHSWGPLSDGTPALLIVLDNARYLTDGSDTSHALNALYQELTTTHVGVASPLPRMDLRPQSLDAPSSQPSQDIPPATNLPATPPIAQPPTLSPSRPLLTVNQPSASIPLDDRSSRPTNRLPLIIGGGVSAVIILLLLVVFITNNNGNRGNATTPDDPNKQLTATRTAAPPTLVSSQLTALSTLAPRTAAPPTVPPRRTAVPPTVAAAVPPRMSLDAFKKLYDDPVRRPVILDVRTTESYASGHIRGAISFPELDVDKRVAELPKDRLIVAYCQ